MMDYIFNSFKIKYINLNSLFSKIDLKEVNSITLYINLESVLSYLLQDKYEEMLQTATKEEVLNNTKCLISNIINLAAHYRAYFTRSKVTSNIVFFYSDFEGYGMFNNTIYNKSYRKHYFNNYHHPNLELVNEIILNSIKISSSIIEYIDSVFIVSSDTIESSTIPLFIHEDTKLKSDLNLILTKDKYDFQYVNHKFLVLYPNKDESIILHKNNLMQYMRYKNNYEDKFKIDLNPSLYSFILSILGDKKRNLDKVTGIGFKKIYKNLEKLYMDDFINDDDKNTLSIEHLSELIKTNNKIGDNNGIRDIIVYNYFCIDLERQVNIANKQSYDLIIEKIDNRFDNNGLKRLNDRTFSDYPIHLIELNNYTKDSVFRDIFKK